MPFTVDIVLPCFNPNDTWHRELLMFYETGKKYYLLNFIVVNDGSTNTQVSSQIEALKSKEVPVTYIEYPVNKGKGYALRQGVAKSSAEFVVCTDIDFPFTTQSMLDLMEALCEKTYDVVAGYRNEVYYQNKMSGFRKLLSKAFRFFIKRVLRMTISDTQCGLKGFNAVGKKKFLQTSINRYLFDFEFIYTCSHDSSLKIKPVRVELKDNVVFSKMKLKVLLQESFNLFYVLVKK